MSAALADAWAAADLLVAKAVGGTIEAHDVKVLRPLARQAARDDDAIAGLQRVGLHADPDELEAVVQLEPPLQRPPAAIRHFHHHERVRVDELEIADDAVDGDLLAAVVDGGNRVVRFNADAGERDSEGEDRSSISPSPDSTVVGLESGLTLADPATLNVAS